MKKALPLIAVACFVALAPAAAQTSLSVYTALEHNLAAKLFDAFYRDARIKVNSTRMGSIELEERVDAEKNAPNSLTAAAGIARARMAPPVPGWATEIHSPAWPPSPGPISRSMPSIERASFNSASEADRSLGAASGQADVAGQHRDLYSRSSFSSWKLSLTTQ